MFIKLPEIRFPARMQTLNCPICLWTRSSGAGGHIGGAKSGNPHRYQVFGMGGRLAACPNPPV
eukprot:4715881-Lingulodinium_polyedra.AAC.1